MSLRSLIFHNYGLKLFSVVLATLIWFAVWFGMQNELRLAQNSFTEPTSRNIVRLPVAVMTVPGDARVFKLVPEDVYVTITGEEAVLVEISKKDIKAYVDLTDPKSREIQSQVVRIHVPLGVTVTRCAPQAVNVEQISP